MSTHPCYIINVDWFSWRWSKKHFLKNQNGPILKDQTLKFLSRPFWFFFASSPWKSVNIYNVARMGRNFYDYPGLQQKSKCAHISVTQCNLLHCTLFDCKFVFLGTIYQLCWWCSFHHKRSVDHSKCRKKLLQRFNKNGTRMPLHCCWNSIPYWFSILCQKYSSYCCYH